MKPSLVLVSHPLCPYVQRAAIVAAEKGIRVDRRTIDLADKPVWFLARSPTGKVPLLQVAGETLFESLPITEYIDDIGPGSLHPTDKLARARHRGWMEFASATLDDIAGLYNAKDKVAFEAKRGALGRRFGQVEAALRPGPWFDGATFHIVDAVWAPVFRYFDVMDLHIDLGVLKNKPAIAAWREALRTRPSVVAAVEDDYPARLLAFLTARRSYLAEVLSLTVS